MQTSMEGRQVGPKGRGKGARLKIKWRIGTRNKRIKNKEAREGSREQEKKKGIKGHKRK